MTTAHDADLPSAIPAAQATAAETLTPEASAPNETPQSDTEKTTVSNPDNIHSQRWQSYLKDCREIINLVEPLEVAGRIIKVTGLVMVATGIKMPIGGACYIPLQDGRF
jgi:flagellum-specific ATP synthase